MSLFEFLMVLVSIIIGLGIVEILTGIARQIRCRESIQGYWIHSVLVAIVFFALLQQWWEIWGVRVEAFLKTFDFAAHKSSRHIEGICGCRKTAVFDNRHKLPKSVLICHCCCIEMMI